MFPSSVIIAGGKQRRDVNAMDPSPHHIQLWPHVRASAAFSEGASGLRALRLVARSAGSSTFCPHLSNRPDRLDPCDMAGCQGRVAHHYWAMMTNITAETCCSSDRGPPYFVEYDAAHVGHGF